MKKDNKGMTLIELLIAITMLALITTPFLNSFIVSVRNNYKARNVLRATTVAQNLMEGLKAFSVEDVCRQVNLDEADATKLYLPNGYAKHEEFLNEAGEKSTVSEHEFVETASHKYVFGIQGIEEDGMLYDARILLDASGYRGTPVQNYNDGVVADIHKMSEITDVIYVLPLEKDREIEGINYEDGNGTLKRTFHIVISDDGGNTKVDINVVYGEGDTKLELPMVGKTVEKLENIYLMYYPNYKSVATNCYDCFEVELKKHVEANLYLVKQKYNTEQLDILGNYAAYLNVREDAGLGETTNPRLTLRTNIGKDLYHSNVSDKIDAVQFAYYQNGSAVAMENIKGAAMLGFVNGGPQSLTGEERKITPLYKAIVQIFPSGTYPDGFDNTEMLVQLEN